MLLLRLDRAAEATAASTPSGRRALAGAARTAAGHGAGQGRPDRPGARRRTPGTATGCATSSAWTRRPELRRLEEQVLRAAFAAAPAPPAPATTVARAPGPRRPPSSAGNGSSRWSGRRCSGRTAGDAGRPGRRGQDPARPARSPTCRRSACGAVDLARSATLAPLPTRSPTPSASTSLRARAAGRAPPRALRAAGAARPRQLRARPGRRGRAWPTSCWPDRSGLGAGHQPGAARRRGRAGPRRPAAGRTGPRGAGEGRHRGPAVRRPGARRPTPARGQPRSPRRWPRSAGASTACRSPSSWPRPGSAPSPWTTSPTGSTPGFDLLRRPPRSGRDPHATLRPSSTGPSTCSTPTSSGCSCGSRCSPRRSTSGRRDRRRGRGPPRGRGRGPRRPAGRPVDADPAGHSGVGRYRMLETLRAYAAYRLEAGGRPAPPPPRAFFADRAEQAEAGLFGPGSGVVGPGRELAGRPAGRLEVGARPRGRGPRGADHRGHHPLRVLAAAGDPGLGPLGSPRCPAPPPGGRVRGRRPLRLVRGRHDEAVELARRGRRGRRRTRAATAVLEALGDVLLLGDLAAPPRRTSRGRDRRPG